MTLAEVTLPVSLEWGRQHCLLFAPQLAERLMELHALHGSGNLILLPRQLDDGVLMLSADVLTEVTPKGLLSAMWEAADKSLLLPSVAVVPMSEVAALQGTPPAEVP
jgi:hypothetical protein